MNKIIFVAIAQLASVLSYAESNYGELVMESNILDGNNGNSQSNTDNILGRTDSVSLSLGGNGGSVVVKLGKTAIDGIGYDLEVNEIGSADGGVDEEYSVSVSQTNEPGSYVSLGDGKAISRFDFSLSGINNVNFVRIDDLSTLTLNSQTPGSDINSISLLHSDSGASTLITGLSTSVKQSSTVISWDKLVSDNITGFVIRKSSDGETFYSKADWSVSKYEHALLITDILEFGTNWISVAPTYRDGTEGIASIAKLDTTPETIVIEENTIHLGDAEITSWEDSSPDTSVSFQVMIPESMKNQKVRLDMEIFNVHYQNKIVINGYSEMYLPVHKPSEFLETSFLINSGIIKSGINTIEIYSSDSSGDTLSNLDDFQIKNVRLTYQK
jgi:hypothetical protein